MQLTAIGGESPLTQAQSGPSPRLVRAAHEFEGQIMKELLQPMTRGDALTGADGESDAGEGSNGILGEFAAESLGQALSQHGGFGIANSIIQELSHAGTGHGAGNGHGDGKVTKKINQKYIMSAP